MASRQKPNWKVLDTLLTILEKEGWSHAQIADDWGMSLATLEGHLTQEVSMSVPWAATIIGTETNAKPCFGSGDHANSSSRAGNQPSAA